MSSANYVRHNHLTRDIRPQGECPACDEYHAKRLPADTVLYEGPLDWGDDDPCAHRNDPCEKCGKLFPLNNEWFPAESVPAKSRPPEDSPVMDERWYQPTRDADTATAEKYERDNWLFAVEMWKSRALKAEAALWDIAEAAEIAAQGGIHNARTEDPSA